MARDIIISAQQDAGDGRHGDGDGAHDGAQSGADKETKKQRELLAWREKIAGKVIKAAVHDAAVRFHDPVDDEEVGALDLAGDYDPIVDEETGARLSDVIDEFAAQTGLATRALQRLVRATVREQWQKQPKKIPDIDGEKFGTYVVNRHGVWLKHNAGAPGLYVWRRIARTPIKPIALSRDTTRQRNWRHCFQITDETGQHNVDIDAADLGKTAHRAIASLMRRGVYIVESNDARKHLAKYLRYKPRARIVRAPRTGWFELKHRWLFVTPDETLGTMRPNDPTVVLDDADRHGSSGFHRAGTVADWRKHVAKPLAGNSNVMIAVGVSVAAPMLRFADEPGGGFHGYGLSKSGKTLIGAVGQSFYGRPYVPGAGADAFGFSWDSTANRIVERAMLRSDLSLYLDEIGVGDAKTTGKAAYTLAGGSDRGRHGQEEQNFNVLFFSTGEQSLAEFLPNARPGQLVRMVDVPALVGPDTAFETIAQDQIANAGKRFYAATAQYHGAVGHAWLEHLVELGPSAIRAKLKRLRAAFWELPPVAEIAARAHPRVVSVINRFALVAAALHMARHAKLLPWSASDVDAGIVASMSRWVSQRGNVDVAGELLREIERRRRTFAATLDDRLIRLRLVGRRLVPASAADRRKLANEAKRTEELFDGPQRRRPDFGAAQGLAAPVDRPRSRRGQEAAARHESTDRRSQRHHSER